VQGVIAEIKKIITREEIEGLECFPFGNILPILLCLREYFTAPVTNNEFNTLKQDINLRVLGLLRDLGVEFAVLPNAQQVSR
jgi:hypothetical protein